MLMGALVIIAKTWKQPRCPSVGEWINKFQKPNNPIKNWAEEIGRAHV